MDVIFNLKRNLVLYLKLIGISLSVLLVGFSIYYLIVNFINWFIYIWFLIAGVLFLFLFKDRRLAVGSWFSKFKEKVKRIS